MIMPFIDWPAIHAKKQGGALTFFLRLVSFIYGSAVLLRLIFYRIGLFRGKPLPSYVVSVGNITTGGTGKTPYIVMLADWAVKKGFSTVILSRGYKRKRSKDSLIVSDGKKLLASADNAGDEPYLLAKRLPSVPVLVSKKRYETGNWAIRLFKPELILLDDGFQHLSLNRNLNILLIDAKRRFGNGFLIPRGPLREPLGQIKRADIIIITRCTDDDSAEDLSDFLKENFSKKPILRSGFFPDQIIFPVSGKSCKPEVVKGKQVAAFAGVAYPKNFLETIKDLGARVIHFKAFPDHHHFSDHDIAEFTSWSEGSDVDFLLTTEKDWARLEGNIDPGLNIAVLTIKIGLLSGEDALFDTINQGILGYRDGENESQIQA